MSTQADLAVRLQVAAGAMADLRPRIEATGPWPLAERFGVEPEASWGPPELLAHVDEMLPYWLGEAERVLAGAVQPVPFGRVRSDPVRVAIIGRDRTVPLGELFARLAADVRRWSDRLASLSDAELDRRGLHPSRGEVSVRDIIERFIVGHLEEHVEQLRAILDASDQRPGA